ncbi:major capsid protein [Blackfly microvirus SF02]|uniref:Major capsid protein n=1 Tax=Blackfly microvirus SF02 TaxID=2576452 RepID=A0A4V1F5F8_9VIRU|nr:major capsid protein [Blackfly microvirus SF02]
MARSVMKHDFSRVPRADIPRSSFDRSHGFKTTFDAGWLVPVFVEEVLPGDTLNLKMTAFGRLSTPLKPVMDNLFVDSFFFFVPNRLLWNNWQKFNGEQDNPGDSTSFLVPQVVMPVGGALVGTLSDYFGIPTQVAGLSVSALWHRAYNLIYNEWFRDENLQNSVVENKGDGPDPYTDYALLRRGKRHDYFTSALPWPQKGPGVSLPLGSRAPIDGIYVYGTTTENNNIANAFNTKGQALGTLPRAVIGDTISTRNVGFQTVTATGAVSASNHPEIYADLANATAATINSLRQAFQIQRMLERDARGGTRYTEIIRSHFGVTSPDARLQRPEYLGGGTSSINVNPVAQTAPTTGGSTPQANLAAVGTLSVHGHGFHTSFVEHGVIIGMVNVRADLNYQQGLNRMWSRQTRYDFYWPAFSHLGEQAILNKEIYAQGTAADNDVFGYQERYAEYRYKPSVITGQMRSTFAQPLDMWHLAQKFTALPLLNAAFIVDTPPVARVVAVPSEPNFLLDAYFDYKCARPMPMYSVPGMMDHF